MVKMTSFVDIMLQFLKDWTHTICLYMRGNTVPCVFHVRSVKSKVCAACSDCLLYEICECRCVCCIWPVQILCARDVLSGLCPGSVKPELTWWQSQLGVAGEHCSWGSGSERVTTNSQQDGQVGENELGVLTPERGSLNWQLNLQCLLQGI